MPRSTSRPIAIVDPYSGGALLAAEFRRRGRESVMVQTTPEIPAQFRSAVRPTDYLEIVRHHGDEGATLERLRRREVEFIVAGCDLGVEPAARWSEALGLVGNGARLATARRDKYLMGKAVGERGLEVAAQHCAHDLEDALGWVRREKVLPVVLKPVASTGSDGVHVCEDEAEIVRSFDAVVGLTNVLGEANDRVLMQEFLAGTEYVIDTVSWEGKHRLAGIWRYLRSRPVDLEFGYDAMQLEDGKGELQDRLSDYVCDVLDALEIGYGPGHCEVIWRGDRPVLVEMGARPTAGINTWINRLCSGVCHLDLTVEAYTDPRRFLSEVGKRYTLGRRAINVFLKPPQRGTLRALPRLDELEALESFYDISVGGTPGEPVPPVIGRAMLLHADDRVLAADLRRIRHLESHGLYEIEPAVEPDESASSDST